MVISRRKFAQTASLTIIGAGLAGSAGKVFSQSLNPGNLTAESFADPLMGFSSATFLPYIGTIFQPVQNGFRQPSLRLTEVLVHPQTKKRSPVTTGECFSLLFRGIGRAALSQQTHTFEHASLGTFSLFIAPFERTPKVYEAVVNHRSRG